MDLSVSLHITTLHTWEGILASTSHFSAQSDGALGDACWARDDNNGWNTTLFSVGYMVPAFST
jgi:hypothetical protein